MVFCPRRRSCNPRADEIGERVAAHIFAEIDRREKERKRVALERREKKEEEKLWQEVAEEFMDEDERVNYQSY